ncbi:MAG: substrate-binding domain-containing protein [Anaerolineae bacterium]|nr:substrate-binding domain-containing protein [Anaerolineae bacterium]
MIRSRKIVPIVGIAMLLAIGLSACAPQATPAPAPVAEPAAPAAEPAAPAEQPAASAPADISADCPELPYTSIGDMVDTTQFKKEPPYTIGFSNTGLGDSWLVFMVQHLKWRASCYPDLIKEVLVTDAESKPEKQLSDVEDLLAKGIDLLIINPATEGALTPAVEKATEMGVPVVVVVRGVDTDEYVSYIESKSVELGKQQAKWLANAIGNKGKIVMMSGIAGASSAEERLTGAREYFATLPEIEVLAHAYTEWSPVKGKQTMENWMQAYPQIDGIWCDSGLQCSGAAEAFMAAGKPVPPLIMEDFNMALKLWKNKDLNAVAFSYPTWMSAVAVDIAMDTLQGKSVPHKIDVPRTEITKETLDNFVRMDKPDDFWADNKLPEDWLPGGAQ